uniref:Junctional adhesion molecule 3 n=1 Tax=Nothobranchius furzeri TaxID=105023 RepID=A0A8C6K5Z5_NOTFU
FKCTEKIFHGNQMGSLCCHVPSSLGVILRTTDKIVWVNEFEPIELTCLIESISTNNPRIEWKKIKSGIPSYVYFQNKITGDLEHRAQLREPANILIFNASRSDTAEYRCEVAAIEDQRDFDEILISLAVRVKPVVPRCSIPESVTVGTSTELRCLENEGFPASQYHWFYNNEELPRDPKSSPRFVNFSYIINPDTGSLKFRRVKKEDAAEYYCQARNDAGYAQCSPQMMEVCEWITCLCIHFLILPLPHPYCSVCGQSGHAVTHVDQSPVAFTKARGEGGGEGTAPNDEPAPVVHFKEPALRAGSFVTDTSLVFKKDQQCK